MVNQILSEPAHQTGPENAHSSGFLTVGVTVSHTVIIFLCIELPAFATKIIVSCWRKKGKTCNLNNWLHWECSSSVPIRIDRVVYVLLNHDCEILTHLIMQP